MFGENPQESAFYPRIINDKAMKRLIGLMERDDLHGGKQILQINILSLH